MRSPFVPGAPAPTFFAPAIGGNPAYAFDSVAGRHVLLLFMGSTALPAMQAALDRLLASRALFDDHRACFFGVTADPADVDQGRVRQLIPGIRFFDDRALAVSRLYRAVGDGPGVPYRPFWLLLDERLRVVAEAPLDRTDAIIALLERRLATPPLEMHAPVLIVPEVLDRATCTDLIARYDAAGGQPSGFMRTEDGKTVLRHDSSFKRRQDHIIEDEPLREHLSRRIRHALLPQIEAAFQFRVTRIERWLIACYDAAEGGFFGAHRDNKSPGTAHRRFACTINLNADDYDGGDLRFPEFGMRTYRAPTGGAVIFSCSLLHEATPVIRGRRYAFLPFFYDDAAAEIRRANNALLGEGVSAYTG
ncbi:2OG-Fe(II) oxygenase [Sphingomonas sp. 1P06PA]|uniref:2OG-Fe(II) oxygenase n=1 Tax=Sphingomonas sp. 1P06PA TaxID=554121 RepID=UPI0039A59F03